MVYQKKKNVKIFLTTIAVLFLPLLASAATIGEVKSFYVDPSYDISARQNISGQLVLETNKLYFYIDGFWWNGLSAEVKNETINNLSILGSEFENKIYPVLTSNYGSEWNPGIDNDSKITIFFHQLKRGAGGYFNSGNEYFKYEIPASNEKEMVYLNSDYLTSPLLKRLLAHEFTHLITYNQKEKINNIEEDVWLNEARAEYAVTLCGYDDAYQGSNLQKRVVEFLKNPNDSLIDWQGFSSDYGVLNIFVQYLADQYGVKILNDSLYSQYKGIESINYALSKYGYKENFSDVFNNWTVAVILNDCSYGSKYCYKNGNLKNLKVIPVIDFLPFDNNTTVYINYFSKSWTGHWDRIDNGKKNVSFDFSGDESGIFSVNYILCDKLSKCEVKPLALDRSQDGKITINNFSSNYSSLTIISFAKNENDSNLQFALQVKSANELSDTSTNDNESVALLTQIDNLKKQIASIQAQLDAKKQGNQNSCGLFNSDLYFGMSNNQNVSCLQQFLKKQGSEIYPEGLITGNFYTKTKIAVIKFQEKYLNEILGPIGLSKGTGIVGQRTRLKINQLLKL